MGKKKIVRTPVRAEGGVTKHELARMREITDRWISNAFRTDRADPSEVGRAIRALYAAAELPAPRVVLVPSPYVGRLAAGLACAVWHLRCGGSTAAATYAATRAATSDATYAATYDATRAATDDATYAATYAATNAATAAATNAATAAATYAATYAATNAATDAATRAATRAATAAATRAATSAATDAATAAATAAATRAATSAATDAATAGWLWELAVEFCGRDGVDLAIGCCDSSWRIYQGGNMWAWFPVYAEAMRDVIGLTGLDCWGKYQAWEDAAKCGGFRYVHEKFCIVSDFPTRLLVNERNQPHCANGPSHEWSDGFRIYHLNGVRFDEALYWCVVRGELSLQEVLAIEDVDQRTQAMRFVDVDALSWHLNARVLDRRVKTAADGEMVNYKLLQFPAGEVFPEGAYYCVFDCPSTGHRHMEGVEPASTVAEAMAWRGSISEMEWECQVPLVHEV